MSKGGEYLTYHNKHYAKRIDPKTKEIVQEYNWNIVPQFLTGKNKKEYFKDQHFYKEIYDHFTKSFEDCGTLLIIGYSFSDTHINEIIKNSIDTRDFKVINVNPRLDFPFRRDYEVKGMTNLRSLNALK